MCICLCKCVHALRGQKRMSPPLELEMVVSSLTRVLKPNFSPLEKQQALKCWATLIMPRTKALWGQGAQCISVSNTWTL